MVYPFLSEKEGLRSYLIQNKSISSSVLAKCFRLVSGGSLKENSHKFIKSSNRPTLFRK